ncbi:MAG TPA: Mur ligase family protein [Acidimicrobiales bacterium]|nr:Mur ligase family protein [Acidimicrobiales bacterium]
MDYGEALAWLHNRINLETIRLPGRVRPPSLDRMHELMKLMAEPQKQYPVIHLTGTNGKTSTARIVTRILQAAGIDVGTFTSPHLERINERIARNDEPIPDDDLAEVLTAISHLEPLMTEAPSFFDVITSAAFRWFADVAVHAAVVEVGMLGTWDTTNVVDGSVAVITNIGADHLDFAPTLEAIAREKAGIVKEGSTLVLGETDPAYASIFDATPAAQVWRRDEDFACVRNDLAHGGRVLSIRTPAAQYDDLFLSLHGAFQGENAAMAVAAVEAFLGQPIETAIVEEALATATSPGRLEVMGRSPLVVVDGAHNQPGAEALAATLVEEFGDAEEWTVVVGLLTPHDPADLLGALDPIRIKTVIATEPSFAPRAVSADVVAAAADDAGYDVAVAPTVASAVREARDVAGEQGRVLVTGSLYVVGDARAVLGDR